MYEYYFIFALVCNVFYEITSIHTSHVTSIADTYLMIIFTLNSANFYDVLINKPYAISILMISIGTYQLVLSYDLSFTV